MLPKAKKSFSQNFLVDPAAVLKIVTAAELSRGERVLEIGPGTGLLTRELLAAGARVTAVEADRDLIPGLEATFGRRLKLVFGDILKFGPAELRTLGLREGNYKLVANLPYHITSAILQKFLTAGPRPSRLVLTVQKEVADRLTAKPPQMSLLSVVGQVYAVCRRVAVIKAGAFRPVPKVDSAVVVLDLAARELVADPEGVIALAKLGFAARRKQLHHNLKAAGLGEREALQESLCELGLSPLCRAENLTVTDWILLKRKLFS